MAKIKALGTQNGTKYRMEFEDDGVFLIVVPAKGTISKEDEYAILSYVKRKGLKNFDSSAIFKAMHIEPNSKVKIGDAQKELILNVELEVRIADGGMKAYARLLPGDKDDSLTLEEAKKNLSKKGVVFGIDEGILARVIEGKDYFNEVQIAEGIKAVDGRDGVIDYYLEFVRVGKPQVLDDGSVDYKHLDLILNVAKGQALAGIIPPTKGKPGQLVTGKPIAPRPGKNINIPKGKNVILSDDKTALIAAVDGKAELIDGKINISPIYEVRGNVDNSTGNIEFVGNVIIRGNILTGFEVKAEGSIEVLGVVEGANLWAKGDVVLKQGMQGRGQGTIETKGNVVTRFIENSKVTAKGDVIAEAIMHSRINCGGKVEVMGRKGLIVGGSISAGSEISALIIGSPMATITELEVGVSPVLREEYSLLIEELNSKTKELKKADKVLNLLNKLESQGNLTGNKADMKLKTLRTQLLYNKEIPRIRARISELDDIFKDISSGRIRAQNKVYPGVKVTVGNCTQYIKDEEKYVTYIREHGDIKRIPF